MKQQVNGYVQEPMAAPQTEIEQEAVVQEDHQQINSTAHVGTSEAQEFSLAIKPKGPPLFKLSALYKSRLKTCIFLHFLLFFAMLAKLSEDILDRMDIFILELEELFIPKPMPFEYLWTGSIIFAIIGLRALSRNRLSSLNSYAAGTVVLGICPLLFAAIWFYSDVAEYAEKKQEAEIEKWQGIPVGLWWYGFITVAVQVHLYSLFFAFKLIKIWRVKLKRA
ncbi:protein jagunal [Trichonephila inaurata madagascariensis]|uniref:Protein jagunal n=1 Tax=Trichonephila inaurata madagascariensis TaxID=2747483 RepID=A0A8X6Y209_9ARAC|nr:protein jagunal [Trichonephila inaurata madagascariensis]